MGIYFPNSSLTEVGTKITATQHIVQTVHNTGTASTATTSTSPVDLYTTATGITLTAASNKILVEFCWENRANDWGDAVWNLYYMDLIHIQSSTQLTYSGYRGEYTYCIRPMRRQYVHSPGSVGPHTYKVRGWCYQANQTTFGGASAGSPDGIYYIRMTEIAA
jgi:hypothetical protein